MSFKKGEMVKVKKVLMGEHLNIILLQYRDLMLCYINNTQ